MQPAPKKSTFPFFKILLVGAFFIVFLAMLARNRSASQPAVVARKTETLNADSSRAAYRVHLQAELKARVIYSFSPNQLTQFYKQKKLADLTYTGKKIYVEGKVASIDNDAVGKPYILFASHDEMSAVQAYMANDKEAKHLTVGQQVTLAGICRGIAMTNVVLTDATEASSIRSLEANLEASK